MKQQITKNAIETAFLKLLKDRNFEKVMVKDIVEECGLTRNTFYYYYDDTYNIIEDILERETRRMIGLLDEGISIFESAKDIFEFLEENPRIVRHLFGSAKKEEMYRYVRSMIEIVLRHYFELQTTGQKLSEQNRRALIQTGKYAVQGTIAEWLEQGMKTSLLKELEQIKELFSVFFENGSG